MDSAAADGSGGRFPLDASGVSTAVSALTPSRPSIGISARDSHPRTAGGQCGQLSLRHAAGRFSNPDGSRKRTVTVARGRARLHCSPCGTRDRRQGGRGRLAPGVARGRPERAARLPARGRGGDRQVDALARRRRGRTRARPARARLATGGGGAEARVRRSRRPARADPGRRPPRAGPAQAAGARGGTARRRLGRGCRSARRRRRRAERARGARGVGAARRRRRRRPVARRSHRRHALLRAAPARLPGVVPARAPPRGGGSRSGAGACARVRRARATTDRTAQPRGDPAAAPGPARPRLLPSDAAAHPRDVRRQSVLRTRARPRARSRHRTDPAAHGSVDAGGARLRPARGLHRRDAGGAHARVRPRAADAGPAPRGRNRAERARSGPAGERGRARSGLGPLHPPAARVHPLPGADAERAAPDASQPRGPRRGPADPGPPPRAVDGRAGRRAAARCSNKPPRRPSRTARRSPPPSWASTRSG